eukprot:4500358-Amphidinium_carterae.2
MARGFETGPKPAHFAVHIQAEAGAIFQDAERAREPSRKPGPSAQQADVPDSHRKDAKIDVGRSTEHTAAACKRAKTGPSRGSSDTRSRPGSSKGRSGSQDRNGGKGKPTGKSFGKSTKSDSSSTWTKKDQVPNSARTLSASVKYDLLSGDALLDSGASHVILRLEELDDGSKEFAKLVKLHLASGSGRDSLVDESEAYAEKVRRTLIPLGKLIRQTVSSVLWIATQLFFLAPACFASGNFVVHMPVTSMLRCALRDAREKCRGTSGSEWKID